MNENTRFWIALLTPILLLGLSGLYGYGKLNAKLDNLEANIKDVKVDLNQRMDRIEHRIDRIEKDLRQLNQNFIDHLKHHNANP